MGIDKVHALVLVVVIGLAAGDPHSRKSHLNQKISQNSRHDFDRSILNHEPRDVDFPVHTKQLLKLQKLARSEDPQYILQTQFLRRFNVKRNHRTKKPRHFRQLGKISDNLPQQYPRRLNVDHFERRQRIKKNRNLTFNDLRRRGRHHSFNLNNIKRNNIFNVTKLLNAVTSKHLHHRFHKHRGRKHTGRNGRREWRQRVAVSGNRNRDVTQLLNRKFASRHTRHPSEDSIRRRLRKLRLKWYVIRNDEDIETVKNCVSKYDCYAHQNMVPVCGSDGNTYVNDCVLNIINCVRSTRGRNKEVTVMHTGRCDTTDSAQRTMQKHTDIPNLH